VVIKNIEGRDGMKNNKRYQVLVSAIALVIIFFVGMPLHTMISEKSTTKRLRMQRPAQQIQQVQPKRYKNKLIWVRTSDNIRMELPQWQIDQMKAVRHKGEGTQYHWIDAPMITSDELELVQKALNVADNLEQFRQFYANLSEDQKEVLINNASKLEMQGLTSLLMTYFFPIPVQEQIGATIAQVSGIIAPVVEYLKKKNQNQEKNLIGHTDVVTCVAYSPDGNYIVSGAADKNLILWNGKTGERIKILKGSVKCLAYSPDGNYIISGSGNNLILWNGRTGEQIKILEGHENRVFCVAYSPDGNYIVSGAADKNLILWNGKTGEKIKILEGHKNVVFCVAYSPDGNYIISGSDDSNLILWDSKNYEKIEILKGHSGLVSCLAYSPDGSSIVSGSWGGNLILWDGKAGEKIKTLQEHGRSVSCVAYSSNGSFIVSGLDNGNLILWNAKMGEQIKILQGHKAWVSCVVYSFDGNYIVSGSDNGNLILWNGKTGERIKILQEHGRSVYCVAYSPDDNYIVSGSGKNLILWKLIDQKTINFIATQLNIAQARFLHRLYLAQKNNVPVILDIQDADYQIYLSLPQDVQKMVKSFLPFELASEVVKKVTQKKLAIAEKMLQEKMDELRSSLFYNQSYFFGKSEKKRDEKIKVIKDVMQTLEKDSIDYKACVRLLQELELEAAFEV
jgi:WD40 repeat protein